MYDVVQGDCRGVIKNHYFSQRWSACNLCMERLYHDDMHVGVEVYYKAISFGKLTISFICLMIYLSLSTDQTHFRNYRTV